MAVSKQHHLGIIGAGGFADFLIRSYRPIKQLTISAIADTDLKRASAVAKKYGISKVYGNYRQLLAMPQIDVVCLPTPPFLHGQITVDALRAGKHVMAEKPLAINAAETNRIRQALASSGKQLSINYVMRRNPLLLKLKGLIDQQLLGPLQSFSFENYAQTSGLPPDHWFWNKRESGGIWVEHGVHFFDLFRWLLETPVKQAVRINATRPGQPSMEDQIAAIFLYRNGVIGTFRHSFSMPGPIERTAYQLVFDHGYVAVEGWIATKLQISGLATSASLQKIQRHFKGHGLEVGAPRIRKVASSQIGRQGQFRADGQFNILIRAEQAKQRLYSQAAEKLMRELLVAMETRRRPAVGFAAAACSLSDALLVK